MLSQSSSEPLALTTILNWDSGVRISLGMLSSGNMQNNPLYPEKSQRVRKKIKRKITISRTTALAEVSQRGWWRAGVRIAGCIFGSAEGLPKLGLSEFPVGPSRRLDFPKRCAKAGPT